MSLGGGKERHQEREGERGERERAIEKDQGRGGGFTPVLVIPLSSPLFTDRGQDGCERSGRWRITVNKCMCVSVYLCVSVFMRVCMCE